MAQQNNNNNNEEPTVPKALGGPTSKRSELDQDETEFLTWTKKLESVEISDKIAIHYFEVKPNVFLRGMIALEDIEQDEELIRIPYWAGISKDSLRMEELTAMAQVVPQYDLNEWCEVVMMTLYEYFEENSLWRPFFQVQPTHFDLPMFWESNLFDELKGTSCYDDQYAGKKQYPNYESMVVWFIEHYPEHFKKEVHTFEMFMWSIALIMSRGFQVNVPIFDESGEVINYEEVALIVPYADMINHASNDKVNVHFVLDAPIEYRFSTIKSLRPIKKGEQLYLTYGDKSNSQLLSQYGFILDYENEHDNIKVAIPKDLIAPAVASSDSEKKLLETKQEIWETFGQYSYVAKANYTVPDDLKAMVQIAISTDLEEVLILKNYLIYLQKTKKYESAYFWNEEVPTCPSGMPDLERKEIYELILKISQHQLDSFPPLVPDEKIQEESDYHLKCAWTVRRDEFAMTKKFIEHLKDILAKM